MTASDDANIAPKALYLEDLAVGNRFRSADYTLTEEEIREFAQRYDPQAFHLDTERARQSLFGGLVASGWHIAAITMRLLVLGGMPLAGGVIGVEANVAWPRPTRPGDTLHAEVEVLEVVPSRSRPERGVLRCGIRTLNQKGETVQSMETKTLVHRRSAAG